MYVGRTRTVGIALWQVEIALDRSMTWFQSAALVVAAAALTHAQTVDSTPGPFSQLTATDDGKEVYFTSRLVLRGSADKAANPQDRLYRASPSGISMFAEWASLGGVPLPNSAAYLDDPQVSGDGSVVAFTAANACPPATLSFCS